jgi:hypothetical protein
MVRAKPQDKVKTLMLHRTLPFPLSGPERAKSKVEDHQKYDQSQHVAEYAVTEKAGKQGSAAFLRTVAVEEQE